MKKLPGSPISVTIPNIKDCGSADDELKHANLLKLNGVCGKGNDIHIPRSVLKGVSRT